MSESLQGAREYTRFFQLSSLYKTPQTLAEEEQYGNAKFRNVLPHGGSYGAFTHVIPVSLSVPNLFPNVNQYRNKMIRFYKTDPIVGPGGNVVQPPGIHTIRSIDYDAINEPELAAAEGRRAFNYVITWPEDNFTAEQFVQYQTQYDELYPTKPSRNHLSYVAEAGSNSVKKFSVKTSSTDDHQYYGDLFLLATIDFWHQLGFTDNQLVKYLQTDSSDSRAVRSASEAFHLVKDDSTSILTTHMLQHVSNTFPGDLITELYYVKITNPDRLDNVYVKANNIPNFGGDQNVLVKASNIAHKSFISAREGASSHNVLAVVPLSNKPYGTTLELQIPNAPLYTILNALGFSKSGNELSSSDSDIINENTVEVTDMKNRPLYIPSNHHVHITVKLMHKRHTGL